MKTTLLIIGLLTLIFVSGCVQEEIVGGPCSYQEYEGRATLVSIEESQITFTIEITDELTDENHLSLYETMQGTEFTEDMNIEGIREGVEVDTSVSLITEGTCTPWSFEFDWSMYETDDTSPPSGESEI